MNYIIAKNTFLKASFISLTGLFAVSVHAAEGDGGNTESWGSPIATYSNINLGSGTEGIDLSANFGGYLGGVYQHRIELAAREDLEHYEANYLLLNSASESGITIDSSWSEDVDFERVNGSGHVNYEDVNTTSIGLFSKLNFPDARFNAYPKMSVGYIWGDNIVETTFVDFEVALLFHFNDTLWLGATPVYTHSMEGREIDEFSGTIDAGAKLSETFGLSASLNEDKEFLGKVIFAF